MMEDVCFRLCTLFLLTAAGYPWLASASDNGTLVDNTTECDYFASRSTYNSTYDLCECDGEFTGNGTVCYYQIKLDCSSNVNDGYAFRVSLNQTYIDYNNISTSSLRFKNASCNNVTIESGYYVLSSPEYDQCGSEQTNSSNAIIYTNAVSSDGGVVFSGVAFYQEFQCIVVSEISLSLTDENGTAIKVLVDDVAGGKIEFPIQGATGVATASMYLYKDADYAEIFNGVPVLATTDTIYAEIALDISLNGVYIIARECWATPDASGTSSERFDILEPPGCLKSSATEGKLTSNGDREEARFQLAVFTFLPSNVVFLHCNVELCTPPAGGTCQPTCPSSRRKRDVQIRTLRSSLIIRSDRPIEERHEYEDQRPVTMSSNSNWLLPLLIALIIILIVAITVLMIYVCSISRRRK